MLNRKAIRHLFVSKVNLTCKCVRKSQLKNFNSRIMDNLSTISVVPFEHPMETFSSPYVIMARYCCNEYIL